MQVLSKLHDGRINSDNYLIQLPIGEYLDLVREVIKANEFQRKRVSSSKSIYSLLKQDIQRGCVIPPIVLALTSVEAQNTPDMGTLAEFIQENKENLVILDGLQRTHSLLDLHDELVSSGNQQALDELSNQTLRIEVYVGINRLGILYRMLTLNTGQTPMSLRQQIEMLYLDYAKVPVDGIRLVRDVENKPASAANEYNFKEIIEGFNSYLERNELPIERADLLENIKSLEKLALENAEQDLFKNYIESWDAFVRKMGQVTNQEALTEPIENGVGIPWGKNSLQVFKKAQAISGFGAAIGRLTDFKLIPGFEGVRAAVDSMPVLEEPQVFLEEINKVVYWINNNSKKIGNAQRMYFQYFFRELLNPQSDAYCKPVEAVEAAFQKYLSQNT